jgi:hypothetical protein
MIQLYVMYTCNFSSTADGDNLGLLESSFALHQHAGAIRLMSYVEVDDWLPYAM